MRPSCVQTIDSFFQTYHPAGDLAFELMRCEKFEASRARFYAAQMVSTFSLAYPDDVNIALGPRPRKPSQEEHHPS